MRVVTDIYRKLLDHCPNGQTLNICTGQTYSLRDVVSLCEKITGTSIEIQVNPEFVRANEVRVLTGDNSKLSSIINDWHAYDLEETLTWMLNDRKVTAG